MASSTRQILDDNISMIKDLQLDTHISNSLGTSETVINRKELSSLAIASWKVWCVCAFSYVSFVAVVVFGLHASAVTALAGRNLPKELMISKRKVQ